MRAPFQIHEKQNIKLLPPEIKTEVACAGKKIRTCFNVKYQSKFDHQHDVNRDVEKIILVRVVVKLKNA